MEFEFDRVSQAQAVIDIQNIGDFGIEAYNDNCEYYYMLVKTVLGETYIATWGYLIPDTEILTESLAVDIFHMQFNNKKIEKTISTFLNDYKKKITGAKVMSAEDTLSYFPDIPKMIRSVMCSE